jgi:hypothetical protein
VRGLEQRYSDRGIPGATDGAVSIRLTRLVFAWRQAEAGSDLFGGSEALRLVDRGPERHGDDGANTWRGHQSATDLVVPRGIAYALVEQDQLLAQGTACDECRCRSDSPQKRRLNIPQV